MKPARLGYSRPTMKFLRMRPGFGEQLIAEGDVEVAEEEQALIEEFRRQLDAGMWAAVPDHARRRPPRGRDGARLRRDPARHRPRHLLPARRRRRGASVIVALAATAIVVLALLWEISMPWIERRLDARRARQGARAAPARPAPPTTPAASAAPSSAPASCSSRA